ncbi:MAG: hypothetical protein WC982_14195 [Advenella sp.]
MSYAENTSVDTYKSIGEIHATVGRYGASQFMHAERGDAAAVSFVVDGRTVRIIVPFPDPEDPRFHETPTGRARKKTAAQDAYEQERRRRYRALALAVKAKLEAVESGIATFEQEFLAYMVMPGGQTFGDWAIPQLDSGNMPKSLPFFGE